MLLEFLKKYAITICLVLALAGTIFYFTQCNPNYRSNHGTVVVTDTTVLERLNSSVDTVQTFLNQFITKVSDPVIIKEQKIDTVFLHTYDDKDVIIKLEKKGTTLHVYAFNRDQKLIKEEIFTNVYGDFTATSATNRVIVSSSFWNWTGLNLGIEHKRLVSDLKKSGETNISLMTGISFKERYQLNGGLEFDIVNKDLKLKGEFKARLF